MLSGWRGAEGFISVVYTVLIEVSNCFVVVFWGSLYESGLVVRTEVGIRAAVFVFARILCIML